MGHGLVDGPSSAAADTLPPLPMEVDQQQQQQMEPKPPPPSRDASADERDVEWGSDHIGNTAPNYGVFKVREEPKECGYNRKSDQFELKRGRVHTIEMEGGKAQEGDFLYVKLMHRNPNDRLRNRITSCGREEHRNPEHRANVMEFPYNVVQYLKDDNNNQVARVQLRQGETELRFKIHCLSSDVESE